MVSKWANGQSIWESHHLLPFLWVFGVGKELWSSPGAFRSFSLRKETQFYWGHQCTKLSTQISLVFPLPIFEMSAEFLLCTWCPSLKCLPLPSTVKQHTYSLPESELQGFIESFLTVSSEKIANSRNNFDRESQTISVTMHCTLHQSLVSIRLFWSLLSRFQQTAHRKPQNKTQTILKQNTHLLETIWELPWINIQNCKILKFHEMNISLDSKVFPSSKIYQKNKQRSSC